jgi:hypothetical protein
VDHRFPVRREAGSPDLVPPKNFVHAGFEGSEIEAPVPVDGNGLVIERKFGLLGRVKPDPALRRGERHSGAGRAGMNRFRILSSCPAHLPLKQTVLCRREFLVVYSYFHVVTLRKSAP